MSKIQSILLGSILVLASFGAFASAYWSPETPVHVNGYTRSNGTHVNSYYRAEPGEGLN